MSTKYKKLDSISHIHQRPDMYIGTNKTREVPSVFLYSDDNKIIFKEHCQINDGLLRIFLEALSNAIDNFYRSRGSTTEMTKMMVTIDPETGWTSVWNDGNGIPIEVHDTEKIYIPELIFGHLLSGSNYDDEEERITSGRNGLGIKLVNVFSKEFKVEVYDVKQQKVYRQKWSNHMRKCNSPTISSKQGKTNYTKISWLPDFSQFGMESYDKNHLHLYKKHVVDAAMMMKIPVYWNQEKFHLKKLGTYVQCYENVKGMVESSFDNIEYCICEQFCSTPVSQVSFVNGISTKEGGLHVDKLSQELFRIVGGKLSKLKVTAKELKPHFTIFVNATVINPEFSSQSKTYLVKCQSNLSFEIPNKVITNIMKWSFIKDLEEWNKMKDMMSLKKSEKKKSGYKRIDGLDAANFAGTKHSKDCVLILCEGLSAKTYSTKGIVKGYGGKKGRNYFGIYPLRGKCLNVRNATLKSVSENKEITDIIHTLNLKFGVDYTNEKEFSTLSYGKVCIVTDADDDGHHICSLILNFFHKLFPSLLKRDPPFFEIMMTPIAKISWSKTNTSTFYSDHDYQKALLENPNRRMDVKYYKGLGTSSDQEIKDSFGEKVVAFVEDEHSEQNFQMIFHKGYTNERKQWLLKYDTYQNDGYTVPDQKYPISLYFNQELMKYSLEDCKRSIPSLFDGLKVSQRKILYSVFKKNLTPQGKSMKVAQLAGYCAEQSNYHHGEQCLFETIIKMSHHFPGSNNIPYFQRDGQFGCLDPHTPVLCWDGSVKQASEIHVGEELIGDDGTKRTVQKVVSGRDEMFQINNWNGTTYTVNQEHILTLYYSIKRKIIDIPIKDFLKLSEDDKQYYYAVQNKAIFDWDKDCIEDGIDFYHLGKEIAQKKNVIPTNYISVEKKYRYDILRGIIDELKCFRYNNQHNYYYLHFDENLYPVDLLAISLGLSCRYDQFGGLQIFGDALSKFDSSIPGLKREWNARYYHYSPFYVLAKGVGEFKGWQLDGNERFILGNGIVTHNSRVYGGKDAANARYIFTKLNVLTRHLFPQEDDALLSYTLDDGDKVQPDAYIPILPTILINGCTAGIGTGWSCFLPCFHVKDILQKTRDFLEGKRRKFELKPHYDEFEGKIEKVGDTKYMTYGNWKLVQEKKKTLYEITELPIGTWTDKYKEELETLQENKKIKGLQNHSTTEKVCFRFEQGSVPMEFNHQNLKLTSTLHLSNMVLFVEKDVIRKFENVHEIFSYYFDRRLELYEKRLEYQITYWKRQLKLCKSRLKFIKAVMKKEIDLLKTSEANVEQYLQTNQYFSDDGYDYLLRISFRDATENKVASLEEKCKEIQKQIENLENSTPKDLWTNDLDAFEKEYDKSIHIL